MDIKKVIKPVRAFCLEYISYLFAIVLFIIIANIDPAFASAYNISNILTKIAPLLILSLGVTFVLLIGSIDLSIGTLASCCCVLFAVILPKSGILAVVVSLGFGACAGLLSGVLYAKLKIPSFITTFGTMGIWQSLALIFSGKSTVSIPYEFKPWIRWYDIQFGVVTLPFILSIIVFLVFCLIEKRTTFARSIYAIGGNEAAARSVGLKVDKVKISVFVIMGILSAVAGIFLAAKSGSGNPTVANSYTLQAIAVVALGGTSLLGGKGGVIKSLAGVILVVLIENGMNVIGLASLYQNIAFGLIILITLLITTDRKRRNLIVK